jgi:DnaJ-class molecular chaperone
LYIKIQVKVPERLSEKQRSLLADFARSEGATDSPQPIALATLG